MSYVMILFVVVGIQRLPLRNVLKFVLVNDQRQSILGRVIFYKKSFDSDRRVHH